jgi:hypothetical protein
MRCQKCCRKLRPDEAIYRTFVFLEGSLKRREICRICVGRLTIEKTLEGPFRPAEPCLVCKRPVFNRAIWEFPRVTCSSLCRKKLAQV